MSTLTGLGEIIEASVSNQQAQRYYAHLQQTQVVMWLPIPLFNNKLTHSSWTFNNQSALLVIWTLPLAINGARYCNQRAHDFFSDRSWSMEKNFPLAINGVGCARSLIFTCYWQLTVQIPKIFKKYLGNVIRNKCWRYFLLIAPKG